MALEDGGYLVGRFNIPSMNGAPGIPGGVFKFDSNGDQVADAAFAHIQDGKSTKGLEITSDQTMVYAARESYVEAFSLNSTGLYSVKSWPLPQGNSPNGICLSDDDNVLYVTDAGYSMNTTGIYPGPTRGGVWAIDSDDNLLQIMDNSAKSYSPNGCVVVQDVVYFASFTHGVHSYDVDTDAWTVTVAWSDQIKDIQEMEGLAGDGISVLYDKFYVSTWKQNTSTTSIGRIYECSVGSGDTCASLAEIPAADIDLKDDVATGITTLLAPDLIGGKVRSVLLFDETAGATNAGVHRLLIMSLLALICGQIHGFFSMNGGSVIS